MAAVVNHIVDPQDIEDSKPALWCRSIKDGTNLTPSEKKAILSKNCLALIPKSKAKCIAVGDLLTDPELNEFSTCIFDKPKSKSPADGSKAQIPDERNYFHTWIQGRKLSCNPSRTIVLRNRFLKANQAIPRFCGVLGRHGAGKGHLAFKFGLVQNVTHDNGTEIIAVIFDFSAPTHLTMLYSRKDFQFFKFEPFILKTLL